MINKSSINQVIIGPASPRADQGQFLEGYAITGGRHDMTASDESLARDEGGGCNPAMQSVMYKIRVNRA